MSKINQSKIDKILSKKEIDYSECVDGVHIWTATSQSNSKDMYIITQQYDTDTWECECKSFVYDKDNTPPTCKHIESIKQLIIKTKEDNSNTISTPKPLKESEGFRKA